MIYHCPHHGSWQPPKNAIYPHERACPECLEEDARSTEHYDRQLSKWRHWYYEAGIPERFRSAILSDLANHEQHQKFSELASLYASKISSGGSTKTSGGYWLYGPPGVGKTHILCAQITAGCEAGLQAHYLSWPHYMIASKQAIGRREEVSGYRQHAEYMESDLLAIDELCLARATEWESNMLMILIDRRYQLGLPTIYAATKRPSRIEAISMPALSRIQQEMIEFPIEGQDLRQNKPSEKRSHAIQKPTRERVHITQAGEYTSETPA